MSPEVVTWRFLPVLKLSHTYFTLLLLLVMLLLLTLEHKEWINGIYEDCTS